MPDLRLIRGGLLTSGLLARPLCANWHVSSTPFHSARGMFVAVFSEELASLSESKTVFTQLALSHSQY